MTVFAKKFAATRGKLLYLVTGQENGKPVWYYLQVEKTKLALFKQALKAERISLEQYGRILCSGWGSTPPSMTVEELAALMDG
jgi:hypothetical protein